MSDLQELLNSPTSENPMDHCVEFDEIKTILEECNNNIKQFQKLCFRSGHESIIHHLVQRLLPVLVEHELLDSKTDKPTESGKATLRKICMFLLVNTDATYTYNLKDDMLVGRIAETCPLMPKFLTMALIFELHLSEFFFEAIGKGLPYWFALQHLAPAIEASSYVPDAIEVIKDLESLQISILQNMLRSLHSDMFIVDRKIVYNKFYDICILLLRQFHTPDAQKLNNLTKRKRQRYAGFALMHLLQMSATACEYYNAPEKALKTLTTLEVYEIGKAAQRNGEDEEDKKPVDVASKTEALRTLKEHLRLIIVALLNTLQNHVLNISVDVYMYWTEIDLTPGRSLQECIGEQSYFLCERLESDENLSHNVEKQLRQFAKKPKSLEEIIHEARIGEILISLEDKTLDYETRKAWFDELLKRNEVYGNEECFETIRSNTKLMSLQNMRDILNHIKLIQSRKETQQMSSNENNNATKSRCTLEEMKQYFGEENDSLDMDMDDDDEDGTDCSELIELFLKCLRNLKTEDLIKLLTYQTEAFGIHNTAFDLKCDFSKRSIEFLNKFASSSSNAFEMQEFLYLCFENSNEMWTKFFEIALTSPEAITKFCHAVKETRNYSWPYFSNLFTNSLTDPTKFGAEFYPNLLEEIYFLLFFPDSKTEFITKYINQQMTSARESEDFNSLLPILHGLILISDHGETQKYKPLNFAELTAPVLVMVALVMDKARWNLDCFTQQREELVRLCIQFVQNTSKKFLPAASEKDREWICSKIKHSVDPFTQYYFQKFGLKPSQPQLEFDQFLRLEDNQSLTESSEIIKFLTINLPYCTTKETEWLVRNDKLRAHIHSAMCLLAQSIEADNMNAVMNFRFCLGNYSNILRKILIPKSSKDNERLESLLRNTLKVLNVTPNPIYDEAFLDFEPILMEVLNKFSASSLPKECFESLEKFIKKMPNGKGQNIFLQKFQTFVSENIR